MGKDGMLTTTCQCFVTNESVQKYNLNGNQTPKLNNIICKTFQPITAEATETTHWGLEEVGKREDDFAKYSSTLKKVKRSSDKKIVCVLYIFHGVMGRYVLIANNNHMLCWVQSVCCFISA